MGLDGQFLILFTLMCIFWEGNYQTAEQQTASDGAASNIARSLESYSTCGRSSSEPTGTISVSWGDLSPSDKVCEWFITAPVKYRVVLSAQMYDIDNSTDCKHNYLEIRDGADASSHLKGKYCGTKFPSGTTSSSNGIYLKFVTDGSRNYVGFTITWSIVLTLSTTGNTHYSFFPVSGGQLQFRLRAEYNAYVVLTTGPSLSNPFYGVWLGWQLNSKTVIGKNYFIVAEAPTPGILSDGEFRGFWIRWYTGTLEVGRQGESMPFLSYNDPQPFGIGYFGVCTWETPGDWVIEAVPSPPLPEIAKLEVTKSTISIVWHINRTLNTYEIRSIRTTCNFVSTDGRGFEKLNQQSENDLRGYGSSTNIMINTTVSNLSPFSEYNCTAAILNYAGYGANSTVVTARTSEDDISIVLGAPTHPNISYVTGTVATLHWGAPDYVARTLTGYEILLACKQRFLKPTSCSNNPWQATFQTEASARQKVFSVPSGYTDYTFSVRAKTNAGPGNYSDSVSILTAPGAPGAVTSFTYSNTTYAEEPNVLDTVLSWQLPCELNGEIESFRLRFNGMRAGFENDTGSSKYYVNGIITADQIFRQNLGELKAEYNYNFEIAAKVVGVSKYGSPSNYNVIYPAGLPSWPEPSYVNAIAADRTYKDKNTLTTTWVVLPLFKNTNGDIKYYAIMVSEIGFNLHSESRFDVSNGNWPPAISWKKANSHNTTVTYQATPNWWHPNATRDIMNVGGHKAVIFMLGQDNSCRNSAATSYCNGPLKPGTWYQVRMRAFTNGGYRDSKDVIVRTKLEVKLNSNLNSTQDEVKALDVKLIPKMNHLFDVNMTWEKPPSPPTHYTVIIEVVNGSGISHETRQNFSGSATGALVPDIKITGHFALNVKPWPKKSVWRQGIVISTGVVGTILVITGVGIAVHKYFKIRTRRRQAQVDEYEMSSDNLVITRVLGTGAFTIVKLGRMRDDQGNRIDVAVKMLRDDSNNEHTHNFHLEIKMMKALDKHPNIVSMLGSRTIGPSPYLVLEYCSRGDLRSFLRKALVEETLPVEEMKKRAVMERKLPRRKDIDVQENLKPSSTSASSEDCVEVSMLDADQDNDSDPDILTPTDMLNFGRQIATGMEFLSSNRIVHRNLATRNILVCHNQTVKISDFGLSRDVHQENIYQKSGLGRMPLKWMAIESITHQIYSTYSDVWSFGVLLWEITTLGGDPYPGVPTFQILKRLQSGYRMEQPENCSDSLYKVMLSCWQAKPKDRPVFAVLRQELDKLISLDAENQYHDLNGVSEEMLIEDDTGAPEKPNQAENQL